MWYFVRATSQVFAGYNGRGLIKRPHVQVLNIRGFRRYLSSGVYLLAVSISTEYNDNHGGENGGCELKER